MSWIAEHFVAEYMVHTVVFYSTKKIYFFPGVGTGKNSCEMEEHKLASSVPFNNYAKSVLLIAGMKEYAGSSFSRHGLHMQNVSNQNHEVLGTIPLLGHPY